MEPLWNYPLPPSPWQGGAEESEAAMKVHCGQMQEDLEAVKPQ